MKTNAAAETSPAQTIAIGRITYKVTPWSLGIQLTGPRGGILDGVRNVNDRTIYVMQGCKTIARLSDAGGTLRRID